MPIANRMLYADTGLPKGRPAPVGDYVEAQIGDSYINSWGITYKTNNGQERTIREAVLAGPQGILMMTTLWEQNKLLTIYFTRTNANINIK